MGLDMYLEKEHYVGGEYEHRKVTGSAIDITINTGTEHERKIYIPLEKVSTINERIAYWRKANQIHTWITQDWDQDVEGEISGEKLFELIDVCKQVITSLESQEIVEKEVDDYWNKRKKVTIKTWPDTNLAEELLPPQEGFFFGSYEINEWYIEDLKNTVEMLENKIDKDDRYKYIASY